MAEGRVAPAALGRRCGRAGLVLDPRSAPSVAERPAAEVRPEEPDLSRGLVVFDGCSLVDDVEIAREDGMPAQAMALLPAGLDMQNLGVGGRTTPMMASDAAAAVDPLYAAAISIVSAAHVGKNGGEERG